MKRKEKTKKKNYKKKRKKRVGFLVDKMALEQVFLQVLHFSLTVSFDQRHSFAFV